MRTVRQLSLLLAWLLLQPVAGEAEARKVLLGAASIAKGRAVQRPRSLAPIRESRIVSAKAFAPTGEERALEPMKPADAATITALGALGKFLPEGTRARKLPISRFRHEAVELGFDLGQQRVGVDGPVQVELALPVLDYARGKIDAATKRPIKTVLVPMAGYDAGSAARLFPDAELIVGVEAKPFMDRARSPRVLKYASLRSSNYTHWQAIEEMEHLAPAVLSSLAWAVPGFRLRGVTLFDTPGQDSGNSAVIEFDGGPGTTPRRYVHLQEWFPHELPKAGKGPWWWKALGSVRPDAIIVKGSQDWRGYASTAGVRQTMRQWLAGGGVLVEGDGEFTELEQSALKVAQDDAQFVSGAKVFPPVMTTKLDDVRFGYNGLRATTF